MTVNINAANITSIRLAEQSSNPGTPASGFASLFVDSNGDLATRKDAGGIKIATSPASGDYTLTVTGTGTAARLNANQTFSGANTFSSNIILSNGIGIDFSATPNTGTSELFDDYEEGNWTPAWAFSTSGSVTTSLAFGRYTKIGNTVFIRMRIGTTALSSPTGDITFTGLPFASTNEANTSNRASLAVGEAYRWTTDMPNIKAQILDNSSSIGIYKSATNSTALTAVQGSDMSAGSNYNTISISGCYHTAS